MSVLLFGWEVEADISGAPPVLYVYDLNLPFYDYSRRILVGFIRVYTIIFFFSSFLNWLSLLGLTLLEL